MRGAFGLVSLLVVIGIMCYVFVLYNKPVIETGKKAHDEAAQIAGRTSDGTPFGETFKRTPEDKGGRLNDIAVTGIVPGSPMETYYGMKNGDQVVTIGEMNVRDLNNDSGLAEALLTDAYRLHQQLVILRGGQQLTLPAQPGAPAAPAASPSAQAPGAPTSLPAAAPSAPPARRGLQDQLDLIRNRPEQ
ncbi:MAG: hypothetical protein JWO87_660 [Phycisphaerales bacterium]|nr:hypothetical protein [Phycisphaerales bacterium]MDB5298997.1 hypothetical protein [Phycisphaerales bacterium]